MGGKSSPDSEHELKRRPTVPEVHEVDLFAPDPYDVSALIISTWACPEDKEKPLRDRLYLSLCSLFIRDRIRRELEWAQQPQSLVPNLACRSEYIVQRDLRTLERRLKDRETAGYMAVAFLQEVQMGALPELPPGVNRLSVNALGTYALEGRGITNETTLKSRVWRPSRSVIHLCVAWATLAQEHFKEHGTPLDPMVAIRRPEFLAPMLHSAQVMESSVERSLLNIKADDLIRFRLLPRGGQKNRNLMTLKNLER